MRRPFCHLVLIWAGVYYFSKAEDETRDRRHNTWDDWDDGLDPHGDWSEQD